MEDQATYSTSTDEEIVSFSVRLPKSIWKLGRLHDIEHGESMNALTVRLWKEYFKSQGKLE